MVSILSFDDSILGAHMLSRKQVDFKGVKTLGID